MYNNDDYYTVSVYRPNVKKPLVYYRSTIEKALNIIFGEFKVYNTSEYSYYFSKTCNAFKKSKDYKTKKFIVEMPKIGNKYVLLKIGKDPLIEELVENLFLKGVKNERN